MEKTEQFEVGKGDIDRIRWVEDDIPTLQDGQVRLDLGLAAFTSNNISYAITGNRFGYWQFFPAQDEDWVRIPVWGFATVTGSNVDAIKVGERIYGYYPMGRTLTVEPAAIKPGFFMDKTAHRVSLPAVYNQYMRCQDDPTYAPDKEALRSLFVPLAATAYGLADWMQQADYLGADAVICLSASSKTSLSTAMMMAPHKGDRKTIGLTSARNKAVVEQIGVYDHVLTYEDISSIDTSIGYVLMDFAGDGAVSSQLHQHLGENMMHHTSVGASHPTAPRKQPGMIAERTKLFFMPSYAAERIKETNGKFLIDMQMVAGKVADDAGSWMQCKAANTRSDMEALYAEVRDGKLAPDEGGILTFTDSE